MSTDLRTIAKLILLICLSLLIAGCERENGSPFFKSQAQTTASAPILNVNVMRVSKVEKAVEISIFFGKLRPSRQSQLRFNQPGRLEKLFKEVGQKVQAGEQIASLEAEAGIIVAPYDCIIASQTAAAGDLVSPQSTVVTVFEKLPVIVEANLPLVITQTLKAGDSVWVVVDQDSDEGSIKAEVKTISPIETTPGSRAVTLQIVDPIESENWSFGQAVKIQFLTATDNSGYWIPVSALSRESTGLWSVLVVADQTIQTENTTSQTSSVRRKMLELIQLEDDWALTQGAFQEGEFVIVNGSHRVVPGQSVNVKDITSLYGKPSMGAGE